MGWDDQVLDEVAKVVDDGADSEYLEEVIRQIKNVQAELKTKEENDFRTDYTRQELINICKLAVNVPMQEWHNRDTYGAITQIGEAWALFHAGVPFRILTKETDDTCFTDARSIWVEFYHIRGFQAFEWGEEALEEATFYLPSPQRLAKRAGKDWY